MRQNNNIMIPSSARDAAMETTEEVLKAINTRMREFHTLYSQANCAHPTADLLANVGRQVYECGVPRGGGDGDAVALDWRLDHFLSNSDVTLNVYAAADDGNVGTGKSPTPYYAHAMLLAHGGRRSRLVEERVRRQRRGGGGTNNDNASSTFASHPSRRGTYRNSLTTSMDRHCA